MINLTALSMAAAVHQLAELPPTVHGLVQFTEPDTETPWATVKVGEANPVGRRSVFPCFSDGNTGDSNRRRMHMGVWAYAGRPETFRVVINRAYRMALTD